MEYAIGAVQRAFQDIGLEDVAADIVDPGTGIAQRVCQIFMPPTGEIVVNDDFADVFAQQSIDCVRADKPAATNDNKTLAVNVHGLFQLGIM